MGIFRLESERISKAKAAYTTRNVDTNAIATILTDLTPKSGDLVLAKIEQIGQHKAVELPNGRKANLFPGDEVLLCYGNRYAPDQFEAVVPENLSPCQMVAAGGIAAQVINQHDKMNFATAITPIGILGNNNGKRINLADWALPPINYSKRPLTIAVVGASMNSGKTTTAANLVKGLVVAGLKVGSAKVTGTGAGGDRWLMHDAGAEPVLDFTDAGFASTYKATLQETQKILNTLITHIAVENVDVIVLEVADGLYQDETAELLSSFAFRQQVDSVVLAVGSALGAMGGVEWLRRYQLPILGISGVITASPLATREAAKATNLAVFDPDLLRQQAAKLVSSLSDSEILQAV